FMCILFLLFNSFFFTSTATPEIYTLSLHDALPICNNCGLRAEFFFLHAQANEQWQCKHQEVAAAHAGVKQANQTYRFWPCAKDRSEEHTSELQSRFDLVCRLLLEKKKKKKKIRIY